MPSGSSQPKTLCCCFSLCDVLLLRSLIYWLFPQFYQEVSLHLLGCLNCKGEAKERNAFVTQERSLQLWFLGGAKAPHALPPYSHGSICPRTEAQEQATPSPQRVWAPNMAARSPRDGRRVCSRSSTLKQSCEWDAKKRERKNDSRSPRFPIIHALLLYIYILSYSIFYMCHTCCLCE